MSIRLFPYFGSKHRLARRYPAPRYDTIVEPFAGAAGYSCRWYRHKVVLYEKDPVVFGVLHYLTHATPEEIRRLPLLQPEQSVDDFQLPQEAKWLIGFWVNAGAASPCKSLSTWGIDAVSGRKGKNTSYWTVYGRERLAYTVRRVRHWVVLPYSWDQIPVGKREATWHVDPPYQQAGKSYRCSSADIDYAALGAWCRQLPGQVMVCENEGADWLPFRPMCQQVGARKVGDGRKISTEVVWYNDGQGFRVPRLL